MWLPAPPTRLVLNQTCARYLNNPEVISGAAFFGLALISGSKLVFALAIVRYISQWWFLSKVEKYVQFFLTCDVVTDGTAPSPHMRKLYGDSIRSDAGFVKVLKKVAQKNARLLESRAGKHGPEIRRVAREVKGTFDKVYEETAEVVEDFLAKCEYSDPMDQVTGRWLTCPPSAPEDQRSRARHEGAPAAVA